MSTMANIIMRNHRIMKMRQENRKRIEEENQELAAKKQFQEQAVELGNVGSETFEGTGWSSFKELVNAQKKKLQDLQFEENRHTVGNFASLLGRNRTLG